MTEAWDTHGVQHNVKKDVFAEAVGEVQGVMVDGKGCWCGVSRDKRLALMQADVRLLGLRTVALTTMERFVGKAGFTQMFKAGARCIFFAVYRWMQAAIARCWRGCRALGRRHPRRALCLCPRCALPAVQSARALVDQG